MHVSESLGDFSIAPSGMESYQIILENASERVGGCLTGQLVPGIERRNGLGCRRITHLSSGVSLPFQNGTQTETASHGGIRHAATVTAPARLFVFWRWRPPRPHPPNNRAVCPPSSDVRVWLQRPEVLKPVWCDGKDHTQCVTVLQTVLCTASPRKKQGRLSSQANYSSRKISPCWQVERTGICTCGLGLGPEHCLRVKLSEILVITRYTLLV